MTNKVRPGVGAGAVSRTTGMILLRIVGILGLLYLFILSVTLLGGGVKLLGTGFAEALFRATANPVTGMMIGLLATAIIQSSSTTTSIIVGLVGSGTLPLAAAIPMVMGANVGTSITNTIVSLAHIRYGDEFRRAFAGSTVHDFFNLCSVIILLPLQAWFDIIGWFAHRAEAAFAGFGGLTFTSPLKAVSKPVAQQVVHLTGDSAWLVIVIALLLLFLALRYIVRMLKSLVLARVERFFQRYIFRNAVLGFILGVVLTVAVQSSSITTSLVVPLIGAGVLSLSQIYPYVLGANVGTTITAFLASFATGSHEAVVVAFSHLIFNIYGITIFWPLKRVPITLANRLADYALRNRLIPILYLAIVFFIIPAGVVLLLD